MSGTVAVRLGRRGDGIAADGAVLPGLLPGEGAGATSPERAAPPCPHYGACGGCAVQHASDRLVAAWKVGIVRQALAARGLGADVAGIATSPPGTRRRAALTGRRPGRGEGGGPVVGFHARASHDVVAIPACKVLLPSLTASLPALGALVAEGAERGGELRLTVTDSEGGVDVAASGGLPAAGARGAALAGIAAEAGLARLSWDGETVALRAPPVQRFGAARVVPPPGAFLQATRHGEAALWAAVREAVGEAGPVLDLFAGCGTFALRLAGAAEVHAIEGEAAMVEALLAGSRAPGLRRVTGEARDLFRRPLRPEEMARFGAAVIDPPRAGAAAQAAELARGGPPRLAYVSCDPGTFARDAATLIAGGYGMGAVRVVDQFRWSTHVELAASFAR